MATSNSCCSAPTEIKQPKRREALIENAEKARISRQLVLLDDKVDLEVPLDDLAVHEPDARKLIAFLKAMEFSTLTRRVADYSHIDPSDVEADAANKSAGAKDAASAAPAMGSDGTSGDLFAGAATPAAKPGAARDDKAASPKGTPVSLAAAREEAIRKIAFDRKKYQTIGSLDQLKAWIARVHDTGHLVIEAMSDSIDPMQAEISGIALALAPNDACYVPLAHKQSGGGTGLFDAGLAPDQIKAADALAVLKPVLESAGILKIGFNIKFNAVMLAQHGITLRNHDDAQLMSYALDAGRNAHGLESLAERWLGHAVISYGELTGSGKNKLTFDQIAIDKAAEYSAESADVIMRLWRVLKPRLVAERMTAVYETLERPLISVLARMERRGISIDRQVLSRLSGDFAQTAARVEAELQELAGEPINVGSPKQIGDILFGKMGISGGTKTKTGAWSTSAQILDELAEQGHEFPKKILEWRQVSKLKSTYTDALPNYVHPQTHRVHTTYALAATTTGRLSSNEPNLQNIPVRTEDGRKIRRAFVATPGHKLVSADYSQIELRLLAEIADIPVLKQAFRDGLDIHAMTASEMFGVPIKDMPSEIRRRAKAINFGIIYGISAFGLANQLGIAREEASAYIKKYFERFPGIRAYMDDTEGVMPQERLCHHAVRPQDVLPRHQGLQRLGPRLQRARVDQRAPAGHRRRHHPPRHDPDGGCAGGEEAFRADAAAGARRTDFRGARERGGGDAAGGAARDAGRPVPRGTAVAAAAGRCTGGEQLGRGALTAALTSSFSPCGRRWIDGAKRRRAG